MYHSLMQHINGIIIPSYTEFIFHTLAPAFIHAQTVASDNNPLVMAVTGTAIY